MFKKSKIGEIRKIKKSVKIAMILVGVFLGIYFIGSLYFINHFYFNTVINKYEIELKNVSQVEEYIKERTKKYSLIIEGKEGKFDRISAESIELDNIFDDSLENILKEQNGFFWIDSLWKAREYEIDELTIYNQGKLENLLKTSILFQNSRKPKDAYIGEYSQTKKMYPMMKEDKGTTLVYNKVRDVVMVSIDTLAANVVLEDQQCYVEPNITTEDKKLKKIGEELNVYTSANITYDWNGAIEIIDGDQIKDWLDIDENGVRINEEAVRERINELSRTHDTFGKKRIFRTATGEDVKLTGGAYGWRVNRSMETEELIHLIKRGEIVHREPIYLYTAYVKGEDDIGNSYVEMDLTKQHLYLFVEGAMVLETDFVSGNVGKGYETPLGIYGITYKERNATLKGINYATPVSYWMPFNGNIGMHDASWRKEFGGEIYQTKGSHGCVNLPKENAETIYGYLEKNFPIICY